MNEIKALANTDTATQPDEYVKIHLNNYLAGKENEDCVDNLDSEVVLFKAKTATKIEKEMHVPYLYLIILVFLKLPTYLQN